VEKGSERGTWQNGLSKMWFLVAVFAESIAGILFWIEASKEWSGGVA